MSIDPRPVIEEIDRRGGRLNAQFLSNLLGEVFPPERYQREPESLTPLSRMADLADELDHRRANPPGGQPFNPSFRSMVLKIGHGALPHWSFRNFSRQQSCGYVDFLRVVGTSSFSQLRCGIAPTGIHPGNR
jgi:hypothetical protein